MECAIIYLRFSLSDHGSSHSLWDVRLHVRKIHQWNIVSFLESQEVKYGETIINMCMTSVFDSADECGGSTFFPKKNKKNVGPNRQA